MLYSDMENCCIMLFFTSHNKNKYFDFLLSGGNLFVLYIEHIHHYYIEEWFSHKKKLPLYTISNSVSKFLCFSNKELLRKRLLHQS